MQNWMIYLICLFILIVFCVICRKRIRAKIALIRPILTRTFVRFTLIIRSLITMKAKTIIRILYGIFAVGVVIGIAFSAFVGLLSLFCLLLLHLANSRMKKMNNEIDLENEIIAVENVRKKKGKKKRRTKRINIREAFVLTCARNYFWIFPLGALFLILILFQGGK